MASEEEAYEILSRKLQSEFQGNSMKRMREFIEIHIGERPLPETHPLQEATKYFFPHVRQIPWYNTSEFAWREVMEGSAADIQQELRNLEESNAGYQLYSDSTDANTVGWPGWDVLPLYASSTYTENGLKCPKTLRALQAVPHGPRQGFFSRMKPGARIYPHTGGTNLFLTCHLALEVPDNCRIRVGDDTRTWEAGKVLVFDDSFIHECWNESDRPRKVLIWDIWHPDVTVDEVGVLNELMKIIDAPMGH